jgi:hypothetical protein
VREQIDRATRGAREQIRERVDLVGIWLCEKSIGGSLDEDVRVAHGDDCAREHAHLDRLRRSMLVEVGRLVGDVEIDVDHLARDCRAGGEERDFFRLTGSAIDHRASGEPTHEPNRARLHVAQERRDDHWDDDEDSDDDSYCDDHDVRHMGDCGGRVERLARGLRDRASTSLCVYRRNAHEITGANAYATRALVRCERREELNELSVELEGDEAVAVRVEAGDGAGFVFDRGLEGRGFAGFEAEEKSPKGADEGGFEGDSGGDGGG